MINNTAERTNTGRHSSLADVCHWPSFNCGTTPLWHHTTTMRGNVSKVIVYQAGKDLKFIEPAEEIVLDLAACGPKLLLPTLQFRVFN